MHDCIYNPHSAADRQQQYANNVKGHLEFRSRISACKAKRKHSVCNIEKQMTNIQHYICVEASQHNGDLEFFDLSIIHDILIDMMTIWIA